MRLLFDSKWFRFAIELAREAEEEESSPDNTGGTFGFAPAYDENENRYEEEYELQFGFRGVSDGRPRRL